MDVYYRLDTGAEILIESLEFSSDPQEGFETYAVRRQAVDVSDHRQIEVIVRASVNGADKALYWDRLEIKTDE